MTIPNPEIVMVQEHFNQLTPEQDELLTCLSEECAEIIQRVGKIQRHGLLAINPLEPEKGTNTDQLHAELGDKQAIMILLSRVGIVELTKLPALAADKLTRIQPWLHHHRVKEATPEQVAEWEARHR